MLCFHRPCFCIRKLSTTQNMNTCKQDYFNGKFRKHEKKLHKQSHRSPLKKVTDQLFNGQPFQGKKVTNNCMVFISIHYLKKFILYWFHKINYNIIYYNNQVSDHSHYTYLRIFYFPWFFILWAVVQISLLITWCFLYSLKIYKVPG